MTNAWIDDVWRSTNAAYKLGRPAGLRGTITQDRGAGIMGVDGDMPASASIDATVTFVKVVDGEEQYSKVGTSTVQVPEFAINSTNWDFDGLAPMSAYIAATRACDVYAMKGSALTTTTVVVNDGSQNFEVIRTNIFDDSMDIPAAAMSDVASIVSELQWLGENGIAKPNIVSVDVEAAITNRRSYGEIVGISVPDGLRTGDNVATVSLVQWGEDTTQTVAVPFKIPAGVPLTGELMATDPAGMDADEDDEFSEDALFSEGDESSSSDRRTVAQAVADLNSELGNNALKVTFAPSDIPSELDEEFVTPKYYKPIVVTKEVDYVVTGGVSKIAPKFRFEPLASTISYNNPAMLLGELLGADNRSAVSVSRTLAGSSTPSSLAGTVYDPEEGPFYYTTPGLPRTAKITFKFAGDADTLPTTGGVTIKVKARTTLSASRTTFKKGKTTTLTAYVAPSTATGKVVFERYVGGRWYSIGTRTLSGGKASMSYKPSKTGTYKIRARYVAASNSTNVASNSSTRTLKVTP